MEQNASHGLQVVSPEDTRPELIIHNEDLTETARELARLISASQKLFDRSGPVRVEQNSNGTGPRIIQMNVQGIVILAHELCRPVALLPTNDTVRQTLPERVAEIYLALLEKHLRPLEGITTSPILCDDGSIRTADGYDSESRLWCDNIPDLSVVAEPTEEHARAALQQIRARFRTFPFADAILRFDAQLSLPVVDISGPPRYDESSFLAAFMTAICRPSLPLAPGFLFTAPYISGAGTGKGLLTEAIIKTAYGIEPEPFTASRRIEEFEKRIESKLIKGALALYIDNVNGIITSDALASALTARMIVIRPLGTSRMITVRPRVFVAVTGNGLFPGEDLVRRFLPMNLNARMPDPESRPFTGDFLREISLERKPLLEAGLTIWRWGRQNEYRLTRGRPLGSYDDCWGRWVRDPLLTLGCADPVSRAR
jgi:hypothetical protein